MHYVFVFQFSSKSFFIVNYSFLLTKPKEFHIFQITLDMAGSSDNSCQIETPQVVTDNIFHYEIHKHS